MEPKGERNSRVSTSYGFARASAESQSSPMAPENRGGVVGCPRYGKNDRFDRIPDPKPWPRQNGSFAEKQQLWIPPNSRETDRSSIKGRGMSSAEQNSRVSIDNGFARTSTGIQRSSTEPENGRGKDEHRRGGRNNRFDRIPNSKQDSLWSPQSGSFSEKQLWQKQDIPQGVPNREMDHEGRTGRGMSIGEQISRVSSNNGFARASMEVAKNGRDEGEHLREGRYDRHRILKPKSCSTQSASFSEEQILRKQEEPQGVPNRETDHVSRKDRADRGLSGGGQISRPFEPAHALEGKGGNGEPEVAEPSFLPSIANKPEKPVRQGRLLEQSSAFETFEGVIAPFIVGECLDMCPSCGKLWQIVVYLIKDCDRTVKEREQRERLRDLAVFERLNNNPRKTSRDLAVKKFCRTISVSDLQPLDVRPLPVLWNTLHYLLNLLDDPEFPFDVIHDFLFDRTRAIRQELGMQHLVNNQVITMYEEIVRFHILSEHELRQQFSGDANFDSHLNLQQLSKTLTSLLDLYNQNSIDNPCRKNEFQAYYVLLNLGNSAEYQPLSSWFRHATHLCMQSPEMKFARKVLRFYRIGNFHAFFQACKDATFLQGCLMKLHFNEVRLKALHAISESGYKHHPIPLSGLAKMVWMKEGDLEELCNLCGLTTGMDDNQIRCLFVKITPFSSPKEVRWYCSSFMADKQFSSYFKEVCCSHQF